MIVSFFPDKKRRVILCSHYDTRPIADQEPDARDSRKPFVSANDGGSGVAMLMELGNHMKDLKTNVGVDFVLFDGEEYTGETKGPNKDEYFIGSKHFAKTWRADRQETAPRLRRRHPARHDGRQEPENPARNAIPTAIIRTCARKCGPSPANKRRSHSIGDWGHEVQDDHLAAAKSQHPGHRPDRFRLRPLAPPERHPGQLLGRELRASGGGAERVAATNEVRGESPAEKTQKSRKIIGSGPGFFAWFAFFCGSLAIAFGGMQSGSTAG